MEITIESANPLKQPSRPTSGERLPSARDLADPLQINVQPQPKDSPVALLGYSEGSWVATPATARRPDLVDLLVLCSAPLTRPWSQTTRHRANTRAGAPRALRILRHALMWTAMTTLSDGSLDITSDLRSIPAPWPWSSARTTRRSTSAERAESSPS